MPELDVLQQALQQLEQELSGFKSAKHLLDEAREKAATDLRHWEQQQAVNAEERAALAEDVKKTCEAAVNLTNQCAPLAERMVVVAKAIDAAGFPHRLDLLQTNTANAVAAIQLLEVNQGNAIKLAVSELKTEVTQAKQELTTLTASAVAAVQAVQMRLDLLEKNHENAIKRAVSELKTEVVQAKQELTTLTASAVAAAQSVQTRLDLLEVNQGNALKLAVNELKTEMVQAKQELTARLVRLMVIWVVSGVLLVGITGSIFWMLWGKM